MNLKRFLAGATSLAVSAGILSIMPFNTGRVYADFEVVSDDFEVNYDGWCDSGENTILLAVENQGNNDTRGMMVTNRSNESDGAYSQKGLYLDGGEKYNYSVFVKHDGEGIETFELALSYQDSKTGEINSKTIATEDVSSGEWAELSTKYKAPKNAQDITLSITTDSISDFFFDDVTITHKRKENMNTVSAANNNVGLKDMYANYFRVGSVLNSGTVTNSTITAVMLKEFNSITHENELKPDATLVQAGSTNNDIKVSLNRAASILNFCAENNIGVRGHTLVWHGQTPEWFFKDNFQNNGAWASQSVMDQRMESYIKNMFAIIKAQYPSLNLYAYDVVNEAVSDDANRTRNFGGAREPGYNNGKSPWVQVYGDNKFIEKAFTYARKYAPASCQLYYNDYNEYWDHKRDSIAAMCTSLYSKGLLDGVGMQSHINADMSGFTGIDTYKTAINKYINIGCDVQITELDISTENGKFSLQQQATKYEAIFKAAVDVNKSSSKGKITAVCVWGPNDTNTWIGSENAPLLFDRNMQPKPAYNALASLIPQSEWGDGSNPGDKPIEPEKPDVNGYYYHDKFEGSMGEWVNRGDAEILLSGRAPYKDAEALLIKDRTGAWNGAQRALNARTFVPGDKYCFSTAAMFLEGGSSVTFCMKLQYVDANGDTQYDTISMKNTIAGEWVHLYNPEYKIPADATNMYVYVETEEDTMNFYMDEAIGAVAGTVITGPAEINLMIGDLNFDGSINSLDLAIAKKGIISGFASNAIKIAADVDGSGVVDIDDVKYLKQYVLGIITEFPGNAPEMPVPEPEQPKFNYQTALQYSAAPDYYLTQCPQPGRIVKETYNSINGNKSLNVYLPYGYNSNKKYNIFYLMHGGGENENTIFSNDVKMNLILDHMIMNGELEPMIVVTPTFNGGNCTAQNFYDEFRANVIPFVEGKYSTYATSTTPEGISASRMHRAYGGFSMGSVSTWAVMVNCLDYVGYFMPLSGDHWSGNSTQDKANSVASAIDRSGLSKRDYFILAATGSEDIAYPNIAPQIDAMKPLPQFDYTSDFSKGNFYFLVAPGATHWWGYVRHYIYDALPYFFHE